MEIIVNYVRADHKLDLFQSLGDDSVAFIVEFVAILGDQYFKYFPLTYFCTTRCPEVNPNLKHCFSTFGARSGLITTCFVVAYTTFEADHAPCPQCAARSWFEHVHSRFPLNCDQVQLT